MSSLAGQPKERPSSWAKAKEKRLLPALQFYSILLYFNFHFYFLFIFFLTFIFILF